MTRDEALRVLGLASEHTLQELTVAYRVQARKRHPDRGGSRIAWDELQEARHVLTTQLEVQVPSPDEDGPQTRTARPRRRWRRLPRHRRLITLALCAPLLFGVWRLLDGAYPPLGWQVPAAVTGYLAAWWVYWLIREARTPVVARASRWAYFWPDAGLGARMAQAMDQTAEK
ncbi:J domain-containing protein [Haloactinopolyspora sp.]|uniref:J domain-containing protein n=1 Tax=Haloactinopolyspora sp. TaxID=1966353 RepID=UPI00262BF513|nr:J domain-containing protein [Haloactinopolyspora sp.]